jgi:hypothetical protein
MRRALAERSQRRRHRSALALKAGNASLDAHPAGHGDRCRRAAARRRNSTNSWTQTVGEVDPLELLEVQLCNSIAPFLLVSRLRPRWRRRVVRPEPGVRRAYVVNVSAMEGQFSRRYKGAGHPHTNMAKAALNMLTRTSAKEMFETDQHPHDRRRHRVDHRRAPASRESCGSPPRAGMRPWTSSTAPRGCTTRSSKARSRRGSVSAVFLKDYRPHPW